MTGFSSDIMSLPTASQEKQGFPPDENPRFVTALIEKIIAEEEAEGEKPHAMETRLRHSDAGKCARYLSLNLLFKSIFTGERIVEGLDLQPAAMDPAGVWVAWLGSRIHEHWQEALEEQHPYAKVDIEIKCRWDDLDGSGHIDAVIRIEGYECPTCDGERLPECPDCHGNWEHVICYELKTVGGFKFKKLVGDRGPAEGPAWTWRYQIGLNAAAADADEAIIGVIATEAISKGIASTKGFTDMGRFTAEWTFTKSEYMDFAIKARTQFERILELYEDDKLAPRWVPEEMPFGARIVDVPNSKWELRGMVTGDDGIEVESILDMGVVWGNARRGQYCDYCRFGLKDGPCDSIGDPGIVPIDDAIERIRATQVSVAVGEGDSE